MPLLYVLCTDQIFKLLCFVNKCVANQMCVLLILVERIYLLILNLILSLTSFFLVMST